MTGAAPAPVGELGDLDIDGEGATDPWDSAAHNQVSTIVVRTRPMNDDDDDDDDAAS